MEIKVKLKGKEIIFGEWEKVGSSNFSWRRVVIPYEPGTHIEWMPNHTKNGIYWYREFQGHGDAEGLYSLRHIYDQMYPDVSFRIDQKQEAMNHMDLFIEKFNSLKAFI